MMVTPNDWDFKNFILIVFDILLSLLFLIGLEFKGINVLILREFVGFIFLAFIPGFIILRILKIHNIDISECLIYSVALSIFIIYLVGLFANFVLPAIGIIKPISLFPILILLTVVIIILIFVAYARDKEYSPIPKKKEKKISLIYPYLTLLPLVAILGAECVNAYNNNIILLILFGLIACFVGLVSFNIFPEQTYPMIVLMIFVGLMLHLSLISPTIYGSDITIEYYLQHIVLQNGWWNWLFANDYNTCLSIVILAPIYSLILRIDGIWIFKIIYPLLFSIIPLGMYQIYKKQIGSLRSFLTAFFFLSIPFVITDVISHARQEIGEIFLISLILLMVDQKQNKFNKSVLALIFCFGLALSHYALAYLLSLMLGLGYILILIIKQLKKHNYFKKYLLKIDISSPLIINLMPILIILIFTVTWHMNVANGSMFQDIVKIGKDMYSSFSEFFIPSETERLVQASLGVGLFQLPLLSIISRLFQYATQLLIIIGFFVMLAPSGKKYKFNSEIIIMIIVNFLILMACIVLPKFSAFLGIERFYHITSYFLAPLCIIGAEFIWQNVRIIFTHINKKIFFSEATGYAFIAILLLIPYFLFTSGFIFAFSNESASIALGPYKTDNYALFNKKEVVASLWISEDVMQTNANIYTDASGKLLLNQRSYPECSLIYDNKVIPNGSFIFLRSWNILYNEILISSFQGVTHMYVHVNLNKRPYLKNRIAMSDTIYNNGGAMVLAVKNQ